MYKTADGIITVFDKSDKKSFENVRSWMDSIKENCPTIGIPVIIVGNKLDIE